MNVHNNNADLLSDNLLFKFNEYFKLYSNRSKISINDLIILVEKEFGYHPTQDEIHDIKSETGPFIDKIYYFVIMGRIVRVLYNHGMERLNEYFETLDVDGNNELTPIELYTAMKKTMLFPPTLSLVRHWFTILDINHKGYITKEEFIAFILPN